MSSQQTEDPSQSSEDEGEALSSSSDDVEIESEASIKEQIGVLVTQILQSNNGDLRAVNWELVAQAASPVFGFTVTGAQCERRFSRIVDRVYPPDQAVTNVQATASAGSPTTSENATPGVPNGGHVAQFPIYGQLPAQSASNGSGHATSAAAPRAAALSVPNPHTNTGSEDKSEEDSEAST